MDPNERHIVGVLESTLVTKKHILITSNILRARWNNFLKPKTYKCPPPLTVKFHKIVLNGLPYSMNNIHPDITCDNPEVEETRPNGLDRSAS